MNNTKLGKIKGRKLFFSTFSTVFSTLDSPQFKTIAHVTIVRCRLKELDRQKAAVFTFFCFEKNALMRNIAFAAVKYKSIATDD